MTKGELAEQFFREGYNCSQSVLLAFSDEIGLKPDVAARIASAFGGGVGRMREMCGTVTGMYLALGLMNGYSDPKDISAKRDLYADVQALAEIFRKDNGSILCRELLSGAGISIQDTPQAEIRTTAYYQKRPCAKLCAYAAQLLDDFLKGKNQNGNIDS